LTPDVEAGAKRTGFLISQFAERSELTCFDPKPERPASQYQPTEETLED